MIGRASGVLPLALIASPAAAQNLGGVFGPGVAPDDTSAEVRYQHVPEEDGRPARTAARVHVQRSVTDTVRLRAVLQGSDDGFSGFRADGVQGEVAWQVTPDGPPFQFGLRGDVRVGWNGLTDLLSANATADYAFNDRLSVRGVVLSQKILGSDAPDPLQWQTRGQVAYRLGDTTAAVEYYGFHGEIGRGGTPDRLQLGPTLTVPIGRFYGTAGVLAGLNDRTADADLRLWVGYRF